MGSNVVNLNKFRKKKERAEKSKQADANRIKHGRTQAQKDRELVDRERATRMLEGKRLEDAVAEVDAPAPPADES